MSSSDHITRFRYLPRTAKTQEGLQGIQPLVTNTVQLIRNLHSEVMELNSELNLLKKVVGLGERELEEYQVEVKRQEMDVRRLEEPGQSWCPNLEDPSYSDIPTVRRRHRRIILNVGGHNTLHSHNLSPLSRGET